MYSVCVMCEDIIKLVLLIIIMYWFIIMYCYYYSIIIIIIDYCNVAIIIGYSYCY